MYKICMVALKELEGMYSEFYGNMHATKGSM